MTLRRLMQPIVQGVFVTVNPTNPISAATSDASSISLRKDRPICATKRFNTAGARYARTTAAADALASLAFSRRQGVIPAPDATALNKRVNLLEKEMLSDTFFNKWAN